MSERETAEFLATVPLLKGRDEIDLLELTCVLRRRTVRRARFSGAGQGDQARELVFIAEGGISACRASARRPLVEIGWGQPRDVAGEIGLLEGGEHTMTSASDRADDDARARPIRLRRAAHIAWIRRRSS